MNRYITLLLLVGLAWGQSHFYGSWTRGDNDMLISSLSLAVNSEVQAEDESAPLDTREARTVLYLEGTTIILYSGLVVNLERSLTPSFSVSAGAGISKAINLFGGNDSAFGPRVQVHYFLPSSLNGLFEVAAGVCFCDPFPVPKEDPLFYLGYRYQPVDGGFIFRLGVAYAHLYAEGLSLSFGQAF